MSRFERLFLIANPAAGRGKDAVLPRLTAALRSRGLAHEVALTERPGHATDLARDAVARGVRLVVAVGGDGTVHEVVNGLVDAETGSSAPDVALGVVPAGTGTDFVRTFGLLVPPELSARHLDGDEVFPVDIGRVRLTGLDGADRTVLFANIAEVGYGAEVVARAARLPRFLGRVRYLLAIFVAIRTFGLEEMRVTTEHTTETGTFSNVVIANGQFFGGAMRVAPRALPDDGRFDVQLWQGSVKDVFLMTNEIRRGEHLKHDEVRQLPAARLELTAARPLLVEADGEVLGETPAQFDLLPKALRLKV